MLKLLGILIVLIFAVTPSCDITKTTHGDGGGGKFYSESAGGGRGISIAGDGGGKGRMGSGNSGWCLSGEGGGPRTIVSFHGHTLINSPSRHSLAQDGDGGNGRLGEGGGGTSTKDGGPKIYNNLYFVANGSGGKGRLGDGGRGNS